LNFFGINGSSKELLITRLSENLVVIFCELDIIYET